MSSAEAMCAGLPKSITHGDYRADNILFETDYPHPVCLYGNVREKIDAQSIDFRA